MQAFLSHWPIVVGALTEIRILTTSTNSSVTRLSFYHHHHHHHTSAMELGHLLTRSGLTYLEVSSEVCHDSFCRLGNSVSLSWVVYHEAFCLHVISSSSCIPVVCLEPVLFLTPLQCVNLFCNLSKCILLFFLTETQNLFLQSATCLNLRGHQKTNIMQYIKVS